MSPFIAASATSLVPAARPSRVMPIAKVATPATHRFIGPSPGPSSRAGESLLDLRQAIGTVSLGILVDLEHVEQAQQQVAGGDGLPLVREVPISFELSVGATDENVRHIVML